MKAILIKDQFILKETRRDIDRESNNLNIQYVLEPMYGLAYTRELSEKRRNFVIQIQKTISEGQWNLIKDTDRDTTTEIFFNKLYELIDIYFKAVHWNQLSQEEKGYVVVERETASGRKYTVKELKANPHSALFERKQMTSIFSGYWTPILDALYNVIEVKTASEIKLVEL